MIFAHQVRWTLAAAVLAMCALSGTAQAAGIERKADDMGGDGKPVMVLALSGFIAKGDVDSLGRFKKDKCQYIVAVKRYDIVEGRERQLPLRRSGDPPPHVDVRPKVEEILRRLEVAKRDSSSGRLPPAEGIDPDRQGILFYLGGGTRFTGATSALAFSGMMFFGTHSLTLFLANVAPDLRVDIASDSSDS
jgi:hypothetical protein